MADDQSGEAHTTDDSGFTHPDEDDIDVVDMDEEFDVDEVEEGDPADLVDGDDDRIERLKEKAASMKDDADEADGADVSSTPVKTRSDEPDEPASTIEPASDSIFSDDDEDELEDALGEVGDLEAIEDIPDDFDYEAQDTADFGIAEDEITIEHNGTYFELKAPTGAKEDRFWSEIQTEQSLTGMFDVIIRYAVNRPDDIAERMERENWTGFAKAGLAVKCSSFLNLDQLQDF